MAASFQFELVSPEKLLLSKAVNEVVLPGSEGYLTVLANHAPMVVRLSAGVVRVKNATEEEQAFVVLGGFADIGAQSCSLLAEQAIPLEGFDLKLLEHRIAEAQIQLQEAKSDENRNRAEDFLYGLTALRDVLAKI